MSTFKIEGQVYHLIGSLLLVNGHSTVMGISFKDEEIHQIIHQRSNICQSEMLYGKCGVAEARFTTLSCAVLARERNPARRN